MRVKNVIWIYSEIRKEVKAGNKILIMLPINQKYIECLNHFKKII